MTLTRHERHLVDPERRADFEAGLLVLLHEMRGAAGFLWADGARSMLDDDLTSVFSEWRTPADHDAFVASDAYAQFSALADVCCREDPAVRTFVS